MTFTTESLPESVPATPLGQTLEAQGSWLFRWRSYVPLPLLALLAAWTYLPPSAAGDVAHRLWALVCLGVGLAGLGVRVGIAGQVPSDTSGRNARRQLARTLNTAGPYSIVRHPLYVGNFVMWMAAALFTGSALMVLISVAYFGLCYERVMLAEERFLRGRFGETYDAWAATTPAVIPRFGGWRPSALPFSWRTAARREFTSMFGLVTVLAILELTRDSALPGPLRPDPLWILLFVAAAVVYLTLLFLKRHTDLLNVPGR